MARPAAPAIPASDWIRLAVGLVIDKVAERLYTQIDRATAAFPGQVDTSSINPQASDVKNFLVQLGYQHTCA